MEQMIKRLDQAINDERLSLKAKGILTIIVFCQEQLNLSIEVIRSMSKDGTRSIRMALNELIEFAYIERQMHKKSGKFNHVTYTIKYE